MATGEEAQLTAADARAILEALDSDRRRASAFDQAGAAERVAAKRKLRTFLAATATGDQS